MDIIIKKSLLVILYTHDLEHVVLFHLLKLFEFFEAYMAISVKVSQLEVSHNNVVIKLGEGHACGIECFYGIEIVREAVVVHNPLLLIKLTIAIGISLMEFDFHEIFLCVFSHVKIDFLEDGAFLLVI